MDRSYESLSEEQYKALSPQADLAIEYFSLDISQDGFLFCFRKTNVSRSNKLLLLLFLR